MLFVRSAEAAESETGEIAYVVDPAARGRGIAPAAVRLLSQWAFAELGLERLQLTIHPDNRASHRVAEKAGYSYEGHASLRQDDPRQPRRRRSVLAASERRVTAVRASS